MSGGEKREAEIFRDQICLLTEYIPGQATPYLSSNSPRFFVFLCVAFPRLIFCDKIVIIPVEFWILLIEQFYSHIQFTTEKI